MTTQLKLIDALLLQTIHRDEVAVALSLVHQCLQIQVLSSPPSVYPWVAGVAIHENRCVPVIQLQQFSTIEYALWIPSIAGGILIATAAPPKSDKIALNEGLLSHRSGVVWVCPTQWLVRAQTIAEKDIVYLDLTSVEQSLKSNVQEHS